MGPKMNLAPTYQAITDALSRDERISHRTPGRGVFVFVREDVGFHDLLITEYPIHSVQGPFIPRLHINKEWAMRRLPAVAARRWGLKTGVEQLFTSLGLEITVLEAQLPVLADSVPAILRHIEAGHRKGFERLLPFDMRLTTTINIWSAEARDLAEQVFRERQKR